MRFTVSVHFWVRRVVRDMADARAGGARQGEARQGRVIRHRRWHRIANGEIYTIASPPYHIRIKDNGSGPRTWMGTGVLHVSMYSIQGV